MKQAILITAYKDKKQLENLINFFASRFLVLIHIDKRSKLSIPEQTNVKVIKKYKIRWGGLGHLLAILELLKLAIQDEEVEYIHIISGQDIPTKSVEDFDYFKNNQNIYMQFEGVKNKNRYFKNRYRKGVLFSNLDSRQPLNHLLNIIYGILHKKNKRIDKYNENQIYIGLVWCSMPRNAANYVLKYISSRNALRNWRHINIPEEYFFQTVLGNSHFRKRIINNNLRYVDWQYRNGSIPAYLDDTDYLKIKKTKCFFARKIDSNISSTLIKLLYNDRHI